MANWKDLRRVLIASPTRIAVQGASFLVLVVLAATVAFIPVGSDWYQGAMAAIGAVATVAAIGLGVVGLAADHARQRIYATLDFVNGLLEQDREGIANVHRWVKQSGVVVLSAEQDADLRRNPDLSRLHDDLRNYLNHLERLSLGVRMGIFDGDLVHRLMFTRVVNARRRTGPTSTAQRPTRTLPDGRRATTSICVGWSTTSGRCAVSNQRARSERCISPLPLPRRTRRQSSDCRAVDCHQMRAGCGRHGRRRCRRADDIFVRLLSCSWTFSGTLAQPAW